MKQIYIFLVALLTVWQTQGQASAYSFAVSSGTYVPITGGTVIITSTDGVPN